MDESGIVTARKPGRAVITVSAGVKLKAKFTVAVTANRAENLVPKPGRADAQALGDGWTLWPRAIEMTADGGAVLEAWVVNGSNRRLTGLEGLELALVSRSEAGEETLLARYTFPKVKAACGKKAVKAVKLAFPKESVRLANANLSDGAVSAALYAVPVGKAGRAAVSYISNAHLPSGADPEADNPAVYLALLVSEDDFYWGEEPGDETQWEHDGRNRGDVKLLADMLSKVSAPNGSRYIVTTRNNTDMQQLLDLIGETFAGADDNDVSLFFIATHGVDLPDASDEIAGALGMASLTDQYPELLPIGTLRDCLLRVPGRVVVLLQSCGSGAAIYQKNGAADPDAAARACAAFDAAVVDAFRDADPGIEEIAANTGELRKANKFYVLTAGAIGESVLGFEKPGEDLNNLFTTWLWQGVGSAGSRPADEQYAGNGDGVVDLHELYRFIAATGRENAIWYEGYLCHQHVQVYPADTRFPLFK